MKVEAAVLGCLSNEYLSPFVCLYLSAFVLLSASLSFFSASFFLNTFSLKKFFKNVCLSLSLSIYLSLSVLLSVYVCPHTQLRRWQLTSQVSILFQLLQHVNMSS